MEKFIDKECCAKSVSPLTLAFLGDGVYDLLIRDFLVTQANRPVGELNRLKISVVCCQAQSKAMKKLLDADFLTEEEMSVYKRGRNSTVNNVPKNSSAADYHSATGFEALLGFLYLQNKIDRITEIFDFAVKEELL